MTSSELDKLVINNYRIQNGLSPILDGIIDSNCYTRSKYKILWILWEPYDDYKNREGLHSPSQNNFYNKENYESGCGGWDCRADIVEKMETYLKIPTWKTIASISSIILCGTPYKDLSAFSATIKSIAFININKYPAGHTSSNRWNLFDEIYKTKGHVLEEQIEFINPEIVIAGNVLYLFKKKLEEQPLFQTFGRNSYKSSSRIYIDALHPSRKGEKYSMEINKAISDWLAPKNARTHNN